MESATNNKYGVDFTQYQFLDLGSKKGGSLRYCEKRFGLGRGIGVDMDPEAVRVCQEAGFPAVCEDVLEFDIDYKFKFVSMLDFLEHVGSVENAESILQKCSRLATDFLFIRHPSFEDMEYLKAIDLKISWYHWDVHTNPMRLTDYAEIFDRLGLKQYCYNYRRPIVDSTDEVVLPLAAPDSALRYDESLGEKPYIQFPRTLYGQIDIFVALRPFEAEEWNKITEHVR